MSQVSGRKDGEREAAQPHHAGRISGPKNLIHINKVPKPVNTGLLACSRAQK